MAERVDEEIAYAVIADGAGRALHEQQRIELFRMPGARQANERRRARIEPEHIRRAQRSGFKATTDFAKIAEANQRVVPYLLAANDRLKSHDLGINRFVAS